MFWSTQLQTAVVSAVTAASITLIIEVLAKPKLEVRKENAVAKARLRRELIGEFRRLGYSILVTYRLMKPSTWQQAQKQMDRLSDDIIECGRKYEYLHVQLSMWQSHAIFACLDKIRSRYDYLASSVYAADSIDNKEERDDYIFQLAGEPLHGSHLDKKVMDMMAATSSAYVALKSWRFNPWTYRKLARTLRESETGNAEEFQSETDSENTGT